MINEIKYTKVRDVKSPARAHLEDAGIDFYIPNDFKEHTLKPGESILIPSGIKFQIPQGYMLLMCNKSGVSTKRGLDILACVCDAGYEGEVHIHLAKVCKDAKDNSSLKPGEKIAQGIIIPVSSAMPVEITNQEYDALSNSERGSGGFGSSGTN